MKGDLIIGVVVSVALHGGAVLLGEWAKKPAPPPVVEEQVDVVKVELPPMEPDEPEFVEEESVQKPLEFAPPMLQDLPQIAPPTAFTMKIQPPVDAMKVDAGSVNIPKDFSASAGVRVFDIKELDTQPQQTMSPAPVYPQSKRREAAKSRVVVRFVIDASGRVTNPTIRQSGGQEFDKAVLDAIVKWRFRAGRKAGKAVHSLMEIPFDFSLK